jgi:flagellar assembly protein FliH
MSELITVRLADARSVAGFRPRFAVVPSDVVPVAAEPAVDSAPFEQGYREGVADAAQASAEERNRLLALLAACEALRPEPSEGLALHIAEAVETLVRLVAGEVSIDVGLLAERARLAAAMVADADGTRTLRLHPDDLAIVDPAALPLAVTGDPSIKRGSLRVEDCAGWVEDGVAERIELLREQLGLKEHAE